VGFELLEQIGRGGLGDVWKGRDDESGQVVVLELLTHLSPDKPADRDTFERAIEAVGRVGSAYVGRAIGSGIREGVPYLAFEDAGGPSLGEQLVEQGPAAWDGARGALKSIGLGLVRVHAAGAAASGLNLSSVFVGDDGLIKVAGFAIAPASADESPAAVRADLDSLGRLAFELLSGTPVGSGGVTARAKAPDLSKVAEEARPIVGWLLAADPDARPQSAQEFLTVLSGQKPVPDAAEVKARKLAATAIEAAAVAPPLVPAAVVPPPPAAPAVAGRRRSPVAIALAVAAVVILVGGLAALAAGLSRGPAATSTIVARVTPTLTTAATPSPSPTLAPTPKPSLSTTWAVAGKVGQGVWGSGIAQLPDGRVLVFDCLRGASYYALIDPATGTATAGGPLQKYQSSAGMAVLPDGSVLAIGGFDLNNYPLATVQRFNPYSTFWDVMAPMTSPRAFPTITVMTDGRVLVAGGWTTHPATGWTASASAEIYDPTANSWSSAGTMSAARSLASAVRLADGRVLVTGGATSWLGSGVTSTTLPIVSSADIYDPGSGVWQSAGPMGQARATHTSAVLPNGLVMVMGGWGNKDQRGLASTEIFDPAAGRWYAAPPMLTPHAQARLVVLQDGRPMVIGGVDGQAKTTAATEVFDPDTGAWQSSGSLPGAAYWPMATVLEDGSVMVVGGVGDSGKYDTSILIWVGPSGHGGVTSTGSRRGA
jgi:hypothetical protein